MKTLITKILFLITLLSLASAKKIKSHKSHKQLNLVSDYNGFQGDLNHVVRRSPSLTSVTSFGESRLEPPATHNYFSNSNTSNLPNVGNLGHDAELVWPQVVMHHKEPISTVVDTPSHIGYRTEKKRLTSYNTDTGKAEHHEISEKIPIYGNVQEVKTVYRDDVKAYDLTNKRFGPLRTTITEH
jgi:hypothetical protein